MHASGGNRWVRGVERKPGTTRAAPEQQQQLIYDRVNRGKPAAGCLQLAIETRVTGVLVCIIWVLQWYSIERDRLARLEAYDLPTLVLVASCDIRPAAVGLARPLATLNIALLTLTNATQLIVVTLCCWFRTTAVSR